MIWALPEDVTQELGGARYLVAATALGDEHGELLRDQGVLGRLVQAVEVRQRVCGRLLRDTLLQQRQRVAPCGGSNRCGRPRSR
jgi:hypothetical protein